MQVTNTSVAYSGMVTTKLARISAAARADSVEAVQAQKDVTKLGLQNQARAMGAEAIINFSVSVATEPHGYKITASGDSVISAEPAPQPSIDIKA